MAIMLLNRSWLRYSAILSGLLVGTLCYTLFRPISFASIATAPIFVTPKLFPFGFEVNPSLILVFLMVLIPAAFGSMALYRTVADWGQEVLTSERMSEGAFACALGAVVASILGSFSTIVYPDNIGMLRATRVGSRYATLAAGVLLVVFGGCIKFDMLLVLVPIPVISAAATLLYGIVFMHGIQILANSSWNDRRLLVAGLSFFVGLGGLFISPAVLQALPLFLRLILEQPVVCGGVTLIVLYSLLCGDQKQTVELQT
jgi:xanthine/uracil permease